MTDSHLIARARPLLGTFVELRVYAPTRNCPRALEAIAAGFAELEIIDGLLSKQRPASDVARLNEACAGSGLKAVAIDWRTREVLEIAAELRRESCGVFDAGGSADRPVDLDGIAKGYAVDRAVLRMREAGAQCGGVNAGGDLRIFNGGQAQPPLYARLPGARPRLLRLRVANHSAIATTYRPADVRCRGDLSPGALVDPRIGRVVDESIWVTVAANSCLLADALTKIVAIDPQVAERCLRLYQASAWRYTLEPREELRHFDPCAAKWLN